MKKVHVPKELREMFATLPPDKVQKFIELFLQNQWENRVAILRKWAFGTLTVGSLMIALSSFFMARETTIVPDIAVRILDGIGMEVLGSGLILFVVELRFRTLEIIEGELEFMHQIIL